VLKHSQNRRDIFRIFIDCDIYCLWFYEPLWIFFIIYSHTLYTSFETKFYCLSTCILHNYPSLIWYICSIYSRTLLSRTRISRFPGNQKWNCRLCVVAISLKVLVASISTWENSILSPNIPKIIIFWRQFHDVCTVYSNQTASGHLFGIFNLFALYYLNIE
jgi:hypothetical protein